MSNLPAARNWRVAKRVGKYKLSRNRTFAVIGLGNFGGTVASELVRLGNHVIGLDVDRDLVGAYVERLDQALIADARDDAALREAGIGDCCTAVVAIGSDVESSVLAAMNLKLVGVPLVWAKATSRTHHRILSRLGVDRVIHPEEEVGQQIAQVLHNPMVRDYVSLGNGYLVVHFRTPEALEGHRLSELNHASKFRLRCLAVMRGSEFVGSDDADCLLNPDDRLVFLGQRKDLRDFAATL